MSDGNSFDEALALHQSGQFAEAERIYRQILQRLPDHPGALHLLGVIHSQRDDYEAAVDFIGRAISVNPNKAVYRNNYGAALMSLGRYDEAIESFRRALSLSPNYADALANLGMAEAVLDHDQAHWRLFGKRRFSTRGTATRRRLAGLLDELGHSKEAAGIIKAVCTENPSPAAFVDLGDFYMKHPRPRHAERAYRKAIDMDPAHAPAHFNLGQTLEALYETAGARQHFARAAHLRLDKPLWRLRAEVCGPIVFESSEEIEEYCERVEMALRTFKADPPSPPAPLPEGEGSLRADGTGTLPATLNDILEAGVFPSFSPSPLGRNPRKLREQFAALYEPYFRDVAIEARRGTRLRVSETAHVPASLARRASIARPRIGILVTRRHEGMFLQSMRGIIENLDDRKFEPVILCSRAIVETLRTGIRRDRLRDVAFTDTFPDAVRAIREAACDLIYYWEVGSDVRNYFLPFARLASVQCTGWGFTVTSGLPAMDWFLSSELVEHAGSQSQYSERLWKSRTLFRYQSRLPPRPPAQPADFGLPDGRHLYVCFQNPLKLHPDFDSIMAGILAADSRALIVLMRDRAGQVARMLEERFARTIPSPPAPLPEGEGRVVFLPPRPFDEYCRLLCLADAVLDPLHFGANSSCYDIFSFNLPVVTLPTDLMPGRMAIGFYRKMGFEELVASSAEDYVRKAVRVATDRDYRKYVTDCIAERSDVLFNDLEAVREHERFFEVVLDGST